jgi:methylaspartate ammonia-lyase
MAGTHTITALLTVPGFTSATTPGQILSVGLVLDNEHLFWGECVGTADFQAEPAAETVQQVVRPRLQGQPITTFKDMAAQLNGLTEKVRLTKTTVAPTLPQPPGPSRRSLLRGQWAADPPPPPPPTIESYEVERPVATAIIYGLSQALLAAVAWAQNKSVIQVLCEEHGLAQPQTAVPLHAEINPNIPLSIQTITSSPIASIGYSISGTNPIVELGKDGEVLQRFARQLKEELIKTADPQSLAFYFNVRGGYWALREDKMGQILGMLYGLEKAAEPFLVRVEDPFILDDRDEQIKKMATLKSYVGSKRMKLQLVARAGIRSTADARAFVERKAAHMLVIDLPQVGSLAESITAVLAAQQHEVGVLLGGSPDETQLAAQNALHLAIALQPTLLLAKPGRLGDAGIAAAYNEMTRILLTSKKLVDMPRP